MTQPYRKWQQECDDAIFNELQREDKCLVQAFCGAGKSKVMQRAKITRGKELVVYTFPSIDLCSQFFGNKDFQLIPAHKMIISSDEHEKATTSPEEIQKFLNKRGNKRICVTYQSLLTLLNCLGEKRINVCFYDEAHHIVGDKTQDIIFKNDVCDKQIFFTATPKNANRIIMYGEGSMCGKTVYRYSYLDGLRDDILNGFDIHLDMYSDDTNRSIYESIARTILKTGNTRILTFHRDVDTERKTTVLEFVDEQEFIETFERVCEEEYPELVGNYKSIRMIGMHAKTENRKDILDKFDETPNDEIFIICSCNTIGEGIDTKRANMVVFVDPKNSIVQITQNIGRIVRKIGLINNASILIPCWVDREKYVGCDGDAEKIDEVIRSEMNDSGNFNTILNVLSALKQEDEELYEACLHYPDTFSPSELKHNLSKQNLKQLEPIGEGGLIENLSHVIGKEISAREESATETIERIAEEENVRIEIHSNSMESPEIYHPESDKIVRLMKTGETYAPIVKKEKTEKVEKDEPTQPPKRKMPRINVHTNPDVRVLWGVVSEIDFTKKICSCVIDCRVIDLWSVHLEELQQFLKDNERKPYDKSKNKEEKKLGKWVQHQIENHREKLQGMMNEERYNQWSEFMEINKEYLMNANDKWYDNYNKLQKFIDDKKKDHQ